MLIHEWTTSATDAVLAASSWWFAYRIKRHSPESDARRGVARALWLCGAAAAIGGVRHGFMTQMSGMAYAVAWYASYVLIMMAGTVLLRSVIYGLIDRTERQHAYETLCVFKLAICVLFFLESADAFWVAVSWGTDVLIIGMWSFGKIQKGWNRLACRWLTMGATVSVIAGLIQQGWLVGTNGPLHDDLFHLVQAGAVYGYYRAALAFSDFRERS